MSVLKPFAGLVIRYAYLWKRQYDLGQEEGAKDRPCAVVLSVVNAAGKPNVLVLAITHTAPDSPSDAIEIPVAVQNSLGLDADRSWIVISEVNEFVWPGPDLRSIPGRDETTMVYGVLPPRLFSQVRDRFLERLRLVGMERVPRTE